MENLRNNSTSFNHAKERIIHEYKLQKRFEKNQNEVLGRRDPENTPIDLSEAALFHLAKATRERIHFCEVLLVIMNVDVPE